MRSIPLVFVALLAAGGVARADLVPMVDMAHQPWERAIADARRTSLPILVRYQGALH